MHPIHDVDAVLLLATALAGKRRPAELAEIMAAADLIHGFVPFEAKLREAFSRLGEHGLICAADGCYALTPAAQEILAGLPKKADAAEHLIWIKGKLGAYKPKGEHAPILLTAEEVVAAIAAYRASAKGAGKNLLIPKPKAAEGDSKRPGQWRRRPPPRGRKA